MAALIFSDGNDFQPAGTGGAAFTCIFGGGGAFGTWHMNHKSTENGWEVDIELWLQVPSYGEVGKLAECTRISLNNLAYSML